MVTGFDSLLCIVYLAATGLKPTEDSTDSALSTSEKLARLQEYDRAGSRGGQLVLCSPMQGDIAQVSDGYWFEVQRKSDDVMHVVLHDLGGPRSSPSSEELPSVPLPKSQSNPKCMVDPDRRTVVVIYDVDGYVVLCWCMTLR